MIVFPCLTSRSLRPSLVIALSFAIVSAGCRTAPAPKPSSPSPAIALQPVQTQPATNSAEKDCGLTDYPVSRSNKEILADVSRPKKPSYEMLAKLAIDENGKITHLRVLRLAHSNATNWKEINENALNSIKRWHGKPTLYQGKPVAVCTDVSVIVDLY